MKGKKKNSNLDEYVDLTYEGVIQIFENRPPSPDKDRPSTSKLQHFVNKTLLRKKRL